MPILTNISVLAACRDEGAQSEIHQIEDARLVWVRDKIAWVGRRGDMPSDYSEEHEIDVRGAVVAPGLVDCHTHLAFGGWRADEFELRSKGVDYLEIARRGGGIRSTVRATRESDSPVLISRCTRFLREMARLGTTTVECKSGYGLSLEHELKILNVYRAVAERQPVNIVSTLLAAHVVPEEFEYAPDDYVQLIVDQIIPRAASLAKFCDVFVEEGAFDDDQARTILEAGLRHGLRPKLHVDQLSDSGGALLAAEVGAISADHLEYASPVGIEAMRNVGVIAVSLPFATLYLKQKPMDGRRFVDAGVSVAVATDFNPGSAPTYHLPLAMTLACTMNGLTPKEALKGATIIGARAIGMDAEVGSLEAGKRADFIVVDAEDINHWLYHFRPSAVRQTFVGGRPVA